jgi:hypothetical protein
VGRSAAQDTPQQPLTSCELPLHATQPQKPLSRETRNEDDPSPVAAPPTLQLRWKHRFPFQRVTTKGASAGSAVPSRMRSFSGRVQFVILFP